MVEEEDSRWMFDVHMKWGGFGFRGKARGKRRRTCQFLAGLNEG